MELEDRKLWKKRTVQQHFAASEDLFEVVIVFVCRGFALILLYGYLHITRFHGPQGLLTDSTRIHGFVGFGGSCGVHKLGDSDGIDASV